MTSLLVLAACGKAGDPANQNPYREELMADGSNINGTYSATLFPMNINLHAPKAGMATFTRQDDTLTAKVKLDVGAQGAYYRQAVYWGNRCPGIEADLNKDGYLDMPEIEAALGDVIIPLDGDIDSQAAGTGQYPSGMNTRGSYFYKKTASFSRFFEDLKAMDPNPNDRVRKLDEQQGFTFLGKVVLIQGASEAFRIPDSVSSYYGLSRTRSLPIACGVIFKSDVVLSDEAETVIVTGEEPRDGRPEPEVTPVPETRPETRPEPRPEPRPQPRPEDDGEEEEDDGDGGVVDEIRNWWNRITGNDDDN